jgi:hypothetical protein
MHPMARMSRYPGSRVPARQLIGGYIQAAERFHSAVRQEEPDPSAYALFEALNWAIALDDYVRKVWKPEDKLLDRGWMAFAGGRALEEILDGSRYVRNLVHHHWADALRYERGRRYPRTYPLVYHSWMWRDVEELPRHPGENRKPEVARNREAYARRLAGSRAEDTFRTLRNEFEKVWEFLDPPRASSRARQDA